MSHDASFIPPNVVPPDPPEVKVVALVFSIFMSFLLIALVGFICFDFVAEMTGHSSNQAVLQPLDSEFLPSEEDARKQTKSPAELITPKHQTRMRGPDIVVIYTQRLPDSPAVSPQLLIDDAPHPWETQFGNNTWFTRCKLAAGEHRVQVKGSEAVFFVETLDSSLRSQELWDWNRPHPDTENIEHCHDCHNAPNTPTGSLTKERNITIGTWKGEASCFACHEKEEHEKRHVFFQSTLYQCHRCHTIH